MVYENKDAMRGANMLQMEGFFKFNIKTEGEWK